MNVTARSPGSDTDFLFVPAGFYDPRASEDDKEEAVMPAGFVSGNVFVELRFFDAAGRRRVLT